MSPGFTVMMPVVRPPWFMPYSIASVSAQTRGDFELCIICDGAPRETIAFAEEAGRRDPRIRVFAFPKGERNGEAHRHAVLAQARSRFVCQIADDDLWLPRHLEEMSRLLETVDFGNVLHVTVGRDNEFFSPFVDLADPLARDRLMTTHDNLFGPTAAGYRLDAYKGLPVGWSAAPPEIPSDLFMWRKFLSQPGIKLGTRFTLTSIHLLTGLRAGRTPEARAAEMKHYFDIVGSPERCGLLEQEVLRQAARVSTWFQAQMSAWRGRCEELEATLARRVALPAQEAPPSDSSRGEGDAGG